MRLIAEPWDIGPGGYQLGAFPPPFLEWNDKFRDDVRGFWRNDPGLCGAMAERITGPLGMVDTAYTADAARIAPIKAAVLPLVKKDEQLVGHAKDVYRALKQAGLNAFYDEKSAIGRRYRRQDEAGTPYCITVDGDTLTDKTVTIRDRDSLEQWRVKLGDVVSEIAKRV